jgi:hypothetical protein
MDSLEKEIRKVYLFYVTIERELYQQINTHLHLRSGYLNFSMKDVLRELDSLIKLSHITHSLSMYINDNMQAIKKILKKFDKKFNKFYPLAVLQFLRKKTENANSDFNYMLQFKIVDEVSAIIEDLLKDMQKHFRLLKKKSKKRVVVVKKESMISTSTINDLTNSKDNIQLNISSEKEIETNLLTSYEKIESLKDFIDDIEYKIATLKQYLCNIDECNTEFRSKIKDWNFYIKNGVQIIHDHIVSGVKNKGEDRTMLASFDGEDGNIMKKFLSDRSKNFYVEKENSLSKENRFNITISLIHTFTYMTIYYITQPTNAEYLTALNASAIFSGLIMGFTPLAAIISTIMFSRWTNKEYKWPMLLTLLFFMIGSLLYIFAWNAGSVLMLGFGRFFIGLGSGRMINRRYLIQFVPKTSMNKYSLHYVTAGVLGVAAGPGIAAILLIIPDFDIGGTLYFNKYILPAWFSFTLALILLIITIVFYSEPKKTEFQVYEKCNLSFHILYYK